jgi:hypothetical protein
MAARRPIIFCVAAMLVLAACNVTPPKPPDIDPLTAPVDYRKQIIEMMPKLVDDPSGMRDTAVTELSLQPVGGATLYTACVRFNPKKSRTEYMGVQERLAVFHGGYLAQFVSVSGGQCAKAAWQPFPELAKLCFGERCPRP